MCGAFISSRLAYSAQSAFERTELKSTCKKDILSTESSIVLSWIRCRAIKYNPYIRRITHKNSSKDSINLPSYSEDKGGFRKLYSGNIGLINQKVGEVCKVCDSNHLLNDCSEFTEISLIDTWDRVKVLGLCFLCLKEGTCILNARKNIVKFVLGNIINYYIVTPTYCHPICYN